MARETKYNNNLVTEEKLKKVCQDNLVLLSDFLEYCKASNKSPKTIYQYKNQLQIFFVWNAEKNNNIFFVNIKKRDYIRFFSYLSNDLDSSPNRVASIRSAISSLSNYVETVLDDEFPTFKNGIKSLEPIQREAVREKTVVGEEIIADIFSALVAAKKYQQACFLGLLVASGMRKSEVLQLKVEDFTTNKKVVLGCMYETGKMRTKGRGKQGKVMTRYVFKELFDPYLELWLKERERLGINNEYLFLRYKHGEFLQAHTATLNSWSRKISSIGGIDFYPHCMRHYFTTMLKRQGYPDDIIVMIQKWANSQMVKIYNDLGESEQLENFFNRVHSGEVELKEIPNIASVVSEKMKEEFNNSQEEE